MLEKYAKTKRNYARAVIVRIVAEITIFRIDAAIIPPPWYGVPAYRYPRPAVASEQ